MLFDIFANIEPLSALLRLDMIAVALLLMLLYIFLLQLRFYCTWSRSIKRFNRT